MTNRCIARLTDAATHVQNSLSMVEALADQLGFRVTSHLVLHLGMAFTTIEEVINTLEDEQEGR